MQCNANNLYLQQQSYNSVNSLLDSCKIFCHASVTFGFPEAEIPTVLSISLSDFLIFLFDMLPKLLYFFLSVRRLKFYAHPSSSTDFDSFSLPGSGLRTINCVENAKH